MKRIFQLLLCLAFLTMIHSRPLYAQDEPKVCPIINDVTTLKAMFPKNADAIANGQQILALLDKNLPLKDGLYLPDELQAFVDKPIALIGFGAVPGSSNDLQTDKNVYVRIITKPVRDLQPWDAPTYGAAVLGTVQGFVLPNRIIVIKISPKNWHITAQM